MQRTTNASDAGWRHALWLTVLVAASVAFTFGFACAVPFAAFGAATALTLNTRDALLLTVAIWLANQLVGFGFLAYPADASAVSWSAVLGVVALLSTLAARAVSTRMRSARWIAVVVASFVAAFVVYEGSLYLVAAAWLGGSEDFAPSIVVEILELNAAACIGLLVLNRLGETMGLSASPSLRGAARLAP
ncbi:MAG TPA: hypothetical protein VKV32_10395 [Stellaceae bacterium]|nr:hypothetical protein [Stellaceae bacterium]